jgi:deazaflavin-dependent oxidoreductase (nitroreductase family)
MATTTPRPPRQRQLSWWEKGIENFAKTKLGGVWFVRIANHLDRPLLRLSKGKISLAPGQPVLLLIHTGAKSGERRETPLLFCTDGDDLVLVASKAGAAKHPAWYHNLKANPRCEAVAPDRSGTYVAREAAEGERERLWNVVNDQYAGYDTYQERAGDRRIPVMVLSPS